MTYPKMILFDYGHTLLYEPDFNMLRGEKALFQYIKTNKHNLTAKEVCDFSEKLFSEIGAARQIGLEMHEFQFQKLLYEYLEITLSLSYAEAEKVFWDNTSRGAVMPGADKMLDYINKTGIRSGVISNIGFSGAALADRIQRLLPNNRFEFIIASSEYMIRKPNPVLFELALKKAGLSASEVWFCGDNVKADVEGAAGAGIYPVWYEERAVENPFTEPGADSEPDFEYLHIYTWDELIQILDEMSRSKKEQNAGF